MSDVHPLRTPCARCGCVEGVFTASGPHTKVTCHGCGAYCYFAPKPPEEKTPPAGRRKPATLEEASFLAELTEAVDAGEALGDFLLSVVTQYRKTGGLTEGQWAALAKSYPRAGIGITVPAPAQKEPHCSFCNDVPSERDGTNGFCTCTERELLSEEHRARYDAIQARGRRQMENQEKKETAPPKRGPITGETLLERLIAAMIIGAGPATRPWDCTNCGKEQEIGVMGYAWRELNQKGNVCCRSCMDRLMVLLEGKPHGQ